MRKKIRPFCLSIFIVAVTFSAANAQDRNSITGFVFDETRRPATEVFVELLTDYYSLVSRVRVQGSGMYLFRNLPQGVYNVKVVSGATDYEEQTKSVSLIPLSVVQGRGVVSEHVDFYLKIRTKKGKPQAAPGVVFAQAVPETAKSLYESGVQDLAEKKDAAGLEKVKQAIEAFPEYFLALDRLGTEYVMRGHYEAAFALFSKAIIVNSRSFSSTFGLGLAQYRLGLSEQAIASFRKSIEINKTSANSQLWLGITLHRANKLPDALTALKKANELTGGTSAEVHWQLARVYKDQQKFALAADELELFLKYKPDAHNTAEIQAMVGSLRKKI